MSKLNFIKSERLAITAIILINLFLRLLRLDSPNIAYLDEKNFFLPAVRNILSGLPDANFEQPLLGKFLIASGIKLFGDNPWGWRIPSVIFAVFACLTVYFFAKKLFGGRFIPAFSALLFTFETAWFVHSRTAMIEVFLAAFIFASFYFLWTYIKENNYKNFIFASISFGLGLSVKWSAFFPILAAILYLIIYQKGKIHNKVKLTSVLIILPLLIYLFSYTPYVFLNDPGKLLSLHQRMWNYHTVWLPQNFEQAAPPYIPKFEYVRNILTNPILWLVDKPATYLEEANKEHIREILFIFNPLIFWPGILALIFSLVQVAKTQDKRLAFLLLIFASSYLPWFFAPRFSIPYYLLFGIPALIINLAFYIEQARRKAPLVVYCYLALIILTFGLFYPVISFMEVPKNYLAFLTSLWQFPIP